MSFFKRYDARIKSAALRHVAPEHVDAVTLHHAAKLDEAGRSGRMTSAQIDALTFGDHDAAFKSIAKDNEHVRRAPDPKPAPLPRVQHGAGRGDYSQLIEQGKKKAHHGK